MRSNRVPVSVLGVAATLVLHAVLLLPVLVAAPGGGKQIPEPRSAVDAESIQFVGWVAVADGSPILANTPVSLRQVGLEIPEIGSLVPSEDPGSLGDGPPPPSRSSSDTMGAAPLYVQRMSQITQRIQREWNVPRGISGDFHCRVLIHRTHESVSEVELEQCDADQALRGSLLRAIDQAAPLPPLDVSSRGPGDIRLEFAAFAADGGGRRTSVEPGAVNR